MTLLRRALIVAIGLVLLALVIRAGVDVWGSRRVTAELAAVEARYGSLDVSTLVLPPVPEGGNRARAMRAAAALVTGYEDVQTSLTALSRDRGTAPVPADLRAFVEANRAALQVADDGRGRRLSNWEADYATGSNTPSLLEIRRLSTALYLEARVALDDGRPDDAARALTTGLALSASLRLEPALLAQLIRMSVALQHLEGVQRLVTHAAPSDAALAMVSMALEDNRTPAPAHVGLLSELRTFHTSLARVTDGDPAGLWQGRPVPWFTRPTYRIAHARYLETMGRLLDAQQGPRPRSVSTPESSSMSLVPPVLSVVPGLERAIDTGDLHDTAVGLTQIAVALRRYRLAQGTYPGALTALVPTYLATVPSDRLSGMPQLYARQADGFTLRSDTRQDDPRLIAAALMWDVRR
ncbi:MAG: hypothetical protein IT185_06005 [Acidobacteria bacterium]|nr:hypothetical protein [Acidobacteriota bacterium]